MKPPQYGMTCRGKQLNCSERYRISFLRMVVCTKILVQRIFWLGGSFAGKRISNHKDHIEHKKDAK
jgi:hypothetical protein